MAQSNCSILLSATVVEGTQMELMKSAPQLPHTTVHLLNCSWLVQGNLSDAENAALQQKDAAQMEAARAAGKVVDVGVHLYDPGDLHMPVHLHIPNTATVSFLKREIERMSGVRSSLHTISENFCAWMSPARLEACACAGLIVTLTLRLANKGMLLNARMTVLIICDCHAAACVDLVFSTRHSTMRSAICSRCHASASVAPSNS